MYKRVHVCHLYTFTRARVCHNLGHTPELRSRKMTGKKNTSVNENNKSKRRALLLLVVV